MADPRTAEAMLAALGGQEYPLTITRHTGLRTYKRLGGGELLADEAAYFDFGPKLGGGWNYTLHRERPPGEQAAAHGQTVQTAVQAMLDQGIW